MSLQSTENVLMSAIVNHKNKKNECYDELIEMERMRGKHRFGWVVVVVVVFFSFPFFLFRAGVLHWNWCCKIVKRTTWYVNDIYSKNATHINCSVVFCTRNWCYTNIIHALRFKCTSRLYEKYELEGFSLGRISMSLSSSLFPRYLWQHIFHHKHFW